MGDLGPVAHFECWIKRPWQNKEISKNIYLFFKNGNIMSLHS
jgi:hypothetical protein